MPDLINDNSTPSEFEASVRHVARQLYRHARSTGSITLDGRERDDIIDTGTELIIVEATKLRKLNKTKDDLEKSIELVKVLRRLNEYSDYNFRIILVTSGDPTADQNEHLKNTKAGCPKEITSFTNFFSRLFDGRHYIRVRGDYSFGSVRDPANEANFKVPQSSYIPTALSQAGAGLSLRASDLATSLASGGVYVVFGDYGSGKSMTLRDIYFRLRDKFSAGQTLCCPIYLNLRDHIAQTQPDEALYRHAEKIGFSEPHSLISAWRAGFVTIFLDGFDELTPPQFASSVKNLKQARRFAVEIVRRFIEQTPVGAAVLVAGRESYFDSRDEAQSALAYPGSAKVFDLAGFTDQEISRFLNTKGNLVPSWLPTRPLLLGYLANTGLFKDDERLLSLDPAMGWDRLLQRVCEREVSQIWGVGFEPSDLRLFIEGLATLARKSRDGRGLDDSGLRTVFRDVFGRDADEPANLLTLRLPGLGALPGRPGAREFIDADFSDAAASGDLCRYIAGPFVESTSLVGVTSPMGDLGRMMVISREGNTASKLSIALEQSSQTGLTVTSIDLMAILTDQQNHYSGKQVVISDINFDSITIDTELNFSNITLIRCILNTVELARSHTHVGHYKNLKFHDCMIDRIEGAVSLEDVPQGMLTGTTSVEKYAAFTATNDAVMSSSLPDPVKVLLTILRKLFLQRGNGRQLSALRRGLPAKLIRYVDPIINEIKANGLAFEITLNRRPILMPNRVRSIDALAIINGPNTSTDRLIAAIRTL